MIASRKHNFIFIKTRKVAGTSIEIALTPHCGPDDIVAPITPEDELIRCRAGGAPRNFSTSPGLEAKYREAIAGGDVGRVRAAYDALRPHLKFWEHSPARLVKERLEPAFWRSAFKFTIDRHPYEYLSSMVYWNAARDGVAPSWLRRQGILLRHIFLKRKNSALYMIGGEAAVDHVLRYENLIGDLREIAPKIGIDLGAALPQAKSGYRPAAAAERSDLGAFHRWLARMRWAREFALYHYQP